MLMTYDSDIPIKSEHDADEENLKTIHPSVSAVVVNDVQVNEVAIQAIVTNCEDQRTCEMTT